MSTGKCYLNALGILCSAGDSKDAVVDMLASRRSALTPSDAFSEGRVLPLGIYTGDLPSLAMCEKRWQSRNNQFALALLEQISHQVSDMISRYGAGRVGVVIGTSTSGIAQSEPAIKQWATTGQVPSYYDYGLQEMGGTAQFIARELKVHGPVYGISTACSSGAKALAAARRLIRAGICDAVIAGGVDTLCRLTVNGFSSLEAVSDTPCNPFSQNRNGINIGEGGALFLVSGERSGIELAGVGEGSDAHHISAPDPTGSGAMRCMSAAIKDAAVTPSEVGYVNLHGTGTELNDQMESLAMYEVFGGKTLCSSTKSFTGHTLGAAGAVEAGICWLVLSEEGRGVLPVHLWDGVYDPALPRLNLVDENSVLNDPLRYALSNSFAFGGNNISLLLGNSVDV